MKYLSFFWALLLVVPLSGQDRDARIAPTQIALPEVALLKMPPQDNQALQEAELKRRQPGRAPRFAEVMAVDVKPQTHGTWEYLKDGRAVWRLRISSPGAYSLNLGFTFYQMPKGGNLILYSPDYKRVIGPFTPADNEEHDQLWTPVLEGDELVVEVQLPKERIPVLGLHLSTVNHDFMGFTRLASGNCNLDVVCDAADGYAFVDAYRDVIQSVAVYGVRGSLFCTGFLVNNTRQDCTPFFMTAAHCEVSASDAASLVVYWNFENSTCRELGSPANAIRGDGRLNDFNSGAILRATYNPSDVALLELDDPVSNTAEAYFAGWTRQNTPPQNGVACIHHPNADEKSISYASRPTYLGTWATGSDRVPNGNHIVVPEWAIGTTETGSSGGPLFNEAGLVVGQLHGGIADCVGGGYDTFGWFATSWVGGGTPATSLRRWLDPDNTGVESLTGRSQRRCSFFVEADIASRDVCAPDEAIYTLSVSEVFSGPVTLEARGLAEGLEASFTVNPVVPGGQTEFHIRGTAQVESGEYGINVIGTDGTESAVAELSLSIFAEPPGFVTLLEPADGAADLGIRANFSWGGQSFASSYEFELATDPEFTNVVASVSDLATPGLGNFALAVLTRYYWRVRGRNLCGWGEWSKPRTFTTAGVGCASVQSRDIPITISGQVNTIISTINITAPGLIQDMRLTGLDITHTFVGDLRVSLISPRGTELFLFDRPGLPRTFFGCDGDDLRLDFSDDALLTATDLENTCNDQPAIVGLFQPLQAFANLKGEPVTGVWTLKIADLVPEDGGRLNRWGLEFCTSLPQERLLFLATDQYYSCVGDPVHLNLLLGTGFVDSVAILAAGLPPEATVIYSKNPASPGASLNVTIEGMATGGTYEIVFRADTTQVKASLQLIDLPAAVVTLYPSEGARVERKAVELAWRSSPGADYYTLTVYEGGTSGTPLLSLPLADTVYLLPDLDFATVYFWQVVPHGVCGGRQPEGFQWFSTFPDLSLAINPSVLSLCQTETASITVAVAPGFSVPASISYRLDPPDTLLLHYNIDPGAVTPGGTVRADLADLRRLSPGAYTLTFTVRDSVYADSVSLALEVLGTPGLARLLEPVNNSELMDPRPTFHWSASSLATRYRLEISADANFTEVLRSQESASLSLRLTDALTPGAYYWRVTAFNRCGGATSAAFRFEIRTTGTTEWEGVTLRWYPNPTNGKVYLEFNRPSSEEVIYRLFNSAGVLLGSGEIGREAKGTEIDLQRFPAGLYLLQLHRRGASLMLRIVKQ